MIVDRHERVNPFALVPKLSTVFEPELRELDQLLEADIVRQRASCGWIVRWSRPMSIIPPIVFCWRMGCSVA